MNNTIHTRYSFGKSYIVDLFLSQSTTGRPQTSGCGASPPAPFHRACSLTSAHLPRRASVSSRPVSRVQNTRASNVGAKESLACAPCRWLPLPLPELLLQAHIALHRCQLVCVAVGAPTWCDAGAGTCGRARQGRAEREQSRGRVTTGIQHDAARTPR